MKKIKQIKERELISIITGIIDSDSGGDVSHVKPLIGPGKDDCAVIDMGGPEFLVATTDMLHKKTDFPPAMTFWQMGWMSVAVNLSDIAAMGARPAGIMAALGLPPDLMLHQVKELVEGMNACARQFGTSIIGGDIDRHDELTIAGSALGLVGRDHLVLRSGARAGELVCVTGELGAAGAALDSIMNNKQAYPYVLRHLFLPVPGVNDGIALAKTGCVTSMTDISDGLALSLHDLAAASNVGFLIRAADIPVHHTVRNMASDEDQVIEWSLYTGGDFVLLFTVRENCLDEVRKAAGFTVIGTVTASGISMERNGTVIPVESRGYQQFGNTK